MLESQDSVISLKTYVILEIRGFKRYFDNN